MPEEKERCTKSVRELSGKTFIVKKYQRGYKWTVRTFAEMISLRRFPMKLILLCPGAHEFILLTSHRLGCVDFPKLRSLPE